jgi:hypothetical protein
MTAQAALNVEISSNTKGLQKKRLGGYYFGPIVPRKEANGCRTSSDITSLSNSSRLQSGAARRKFHPRARGDDVIE